MFSRGVQRVRAQRRLNGKARARRAAAALLIASVVACGGGGGGGGQGRLSTSGGSGRGPLRLEPHFELTGVSLRELSWQGGSLLGSYGSDDAGGGVWDIAGGRLRFEVEAFSQSAFSADGNNVMLLGDMLDAGLYATRSGERVSSTRPPVARGASDWRRDQVADDDDDERCDAFTAMRPDGRAIASLDCDGGLIVWDPRTGAELYSVGRSEEELYPQFSPSGTRLIATDQGSKTHLVDGHSGSEIAVLQAVPEPGCGSGSFSEDGRRLLLGVRGGLKVFDAQTGREVGSIDVEQVRCARLSPDGRFALVRDRGRNVLVRVLDGQIMHESREGETVFSRASDFVATVQYGNRDGAERRLVRVWRGDGWSRPVATVQAAHAVASIALSDDGSLLATLDQAGGIAIWETTTGNRLASARAVNADASTGIHIAPSGEYVILWGEQGVQVWRARR